MAKRKNHTNHNQIRKAHRNGIKKVRKSSKPDTRGVHPPLLLNTYYAQLYNGIGRKAYEERQKQKN
jgi:large subunit ribosomal protein L29e